MEKTGALKERRAKEIISSIISSSKSEAEANRKLLASNCYDDDNTINRINRIIDDERIPKCQFLEDYFRQQDTYCYINCKFDLKPAIMHNLAKGFPNRLDRKNEQVRSAHPAVLPLSILRRRDPPRALRGPRAGQHDPQTLEARVPAEQTGHHLRQELAGRRLHFFPEHLPLHEAAIVE